MVLISRTVPEPHADEHAGPPPLPTLLRGMTVVSGGPLALAAWTVLAPVSALRRWPQRLDRGRAAAWALTAGGLAVPAVYAAAVRPWLQHWGSTEEERARRYPGDGDRDPWFRVTRAVTVEAPAEQVWRWLVQIGEDRGGFYSYDWLERLAGCRLHSAEEVHDEWQDLHVGDRLALLAGKGPAIEAVDPPRSLVIEGWGSYVVEPLDERRCRLVARSHTDPGPGAVAYLLAMELPHAIMERKMLLGIKKRAERAARRGSPG